MFLSIYPLLLFLRVWHSNSRMQLGMFGLEELLSLTSWRLVNLPRWCLCLEAQHFGVRESGTISYEFKTSLDGHSVYGILFSGGQLERQLSNLKCSKLSYLQFPKVQSPFWLLGPVHMTHNHIPVSHPYMHKCFKGRKARNGSLGKACEDQTPEDFCICMSIKIYFVCMSIKVSDSLELEL